jgi:hypothetical protein
MTQYRIVRRGVCGAGNYFVQKRGWFFWEDISITSKPKSFPFTTLSEAKENLVSLLAQTKDNNAKDLVVYQTEQ